MALPFPTSKFNFVIPNRAESPVRNLVFAWSGNNVAAA